MKVLNSILVDSGQGSNINIYGTKTGLYRWGMRLGGSGAESGSNVGSDFEVNRYADDGSYIGVMLFGKRSTGHLIIGGTTDQGEELQIIGNQRIQYSGISLLIGADTGSLTTLTNSVDKVGIVAFPHYNTAEENVAAFRLICQTGGSNIQIGGGTAAANAVTSIQFYTSSNNTTLTGSERMRIDATGCVGIGTDFSAMDSSKAFSINRTFTSVSSTGILSVANQSAGDTSGSNSLYGIDVRSYASHTANTITYQYGVRAVTRGYGTGGTITNMYGFYSLMDINTGVPTIGTAMHFAAPDITFAATNIYGFYGGLSAGTGKWNLFASGTAKNYLKATLLIGSTVDFNSSTYLQVTSPDANTIRCHREWAVAEAAAGRVLFTGWDSVNATTIYGAVGAIIENGTDGAERGSICIYTGVLGTWSAEHSRFYSNSNCVYLGGSGVWDAISKVRIGDLTTSVGFAPILIRAAGTINTADTASIMSMFLGATYMPTGATLANAYSIYSQPIINNAIAPANFYGILSKLNFGASAGGAITTARGFASYMNSYNAAATTVVQTYIHYESNEINRSTYPNIGTSGIYGFWSGITHEAESNKWNFYGQGSAANYFAGDLRIGQTTELGCKLDVRRDYTTGYTGTELPAAGANLPAICIRNLQSSIDNAAAYLMFQISGTAGNAQGFMAMVKPTNDSRSDFVWCGRNSTATMAEKMRLTGLGDFIVGMSSTNYFETKLSNSTGQVVLTAKSTLAGTSILDIQTLTAAGSDSSYIRLFRSTNSTGTVALQIMKGNNSATAQHQLRGNGMSFMCADSGNLLIGSTADDTANKLQVTGSIKATTSINSNDKVMLTPEGGIAVKYTNKTGAASVKGYLVTVYDTTAIDSAVKLSLVDVPTCIGVIYEAGIADGSEVWVVVSGKAEAYFGGDATRGHLARTTRTGDAFTTSGYALSEAAPTSPFATDKHFMEIGHVMSSRTGAGLAWVNLHFN